MLIKPALTFTSQLGMNKKACDAFVLVSVSYCYCKKISYGNRFYFLPTRFNGIVSQTINSSNTLFSIFSYAFPLSTGACAKALTLLYAFLF